MFVGMLQDMYISLLSPWIVYVMRIPKRVRLALITLCFIADILLFGIVRYVLRKDSYFYNTTLGILLMIAIAILSLDKELVRIHWHRSLRIAWFGMCVAFTVSDIIVPKRICGLGIVLGVVFTGVFFVWQNNPRKDLLWDCFKKAIRHTFWITSIFSFLFRPLYDGGRYTGIFTNPNTFGLYLIIILAVFLSDLDWDVVTGKYWYRSLSTYISIALIWFYLLKSQARTSLATAVVMMLMWIVFRIRKCIVTHRWRLFIKNALLTVFITIALYPVFLIGVTYLPWTVGHPLILDGEPLYLSDGSKVLDMGDTVIAEPDSTAESFLVGAEIEQGQIQPGIRYSSDTDAPENPIVPQNVMERIWFILENTKGLNALMTGRIEIYKGYYKQLNYKGHAGVSLTVNGSYEAHAHNNWLQFGYTYGYFGMIFYFITTVLVVYYAMLYYKKRNRLNASYAFLIPAVVVGFVVSTITECLFLPFEVFPAFAFWFVCGEVFIKELEPNRFKRVRTDNSGL